jgi:hypothetical protein
MKSSLALTILGLFFFALVCVDPDLLMLRINSIA